MLNFAPKAYFINYLNKKSEESKAPVYSYMFALDFDYDNGKPAWHCADIPFFFHNADLVPICSIDGVTEKLEKEMAGSFINFARTGNPNHNELVNWPTYTPDNKATMVFDRTTEVRVDYDAKLVNLLRSLMPPFDFGAISMLLDADDADEDEGELTPWVY